MAARQSRATLASLGLVLVSLLCVDCSQARPAIDIQASRLGEAINREICFSHFWYGVEYRLGVTVPLVLSRDGTVINAWSDQLLASNDQFTTNFEIKFNETVPFVASSKSYNKKLYPDLDSNGKYDEVITINIPHDCSPIHKQSIEKLHVIDKIIRRQLISMSAFKDQHDIDVIVANVDDLYPVSLAFIPDTNELFLITIDPGSDEDAFLKGNYLFGQLYNRNHIETIMPKLSQFGIRRRIHLR